MTTRSARTDLRGEVFPAKARYDDRAIFFARSQGARFESRVNNGVHEIELYDEISPWGVDARSFRNALKGVKASRIVLRINSPGGWVHEGFAIANDLRDHPATVDVIVTGLCASIATVVAMAADKVYMAQGTRMMIHRPWGFVVGVADEMRQYADLLDAYNLDIAKAYNARMTVSEEKILALMEAETWFTGEEAVAIGLADELHESDADLSAKFNLSRFRHAPDEMSAHGTPIPTTTRDLEKALRDAGLGRAAAKKTVANFTRANVSQRDAEGKNALATILADLRSASSTLERLTEGQEI